VDKVEVDNKTREKVKWWRLREKEMHNQFREVLESGVMESEGGYEVIASKVRNTAKELLGAVSGRRGREG